MALGQDCAELDVGTFVSAFQIYFQGGPASEGDK